MCVEAARDGGGSRAGQPHADSFDQGRVVGRLPSRDLIISFPNVSWVLTADLPCSRGQRRQIETDSLQARIKHQRAIATPKNVGHQGS